MSLRAQKAVVGRRPTTAFLFRGAHTMASALSAVLATSRTTSTVTTFMAAATWDVWLPDPGDSRRMAASYYRLSPMSAAKSAQRIE